MGKASGLLHIHWLNKHLLNARGPGMRVGAGERRTRQDSVCKDSMHWRRNKKDLSPMGSANNNKLDDNIKNRDDSQGGSN